jgi:hypothetical protein
MQAMFEALLDLLKTPVSAQRRVKTDNSVLLIYPPEKELDFREQLLDSFVPALDAQKVACQTVDLSGFLFEGLSEEEIEGLQEDEFDDYSWMLRGLARRVEGTLQARLTDLAARCAGGNLLLYGTVSLFPLIRFGEVLRELRDLECRLILAFPGEERGGRLHFMNHLDGGNYLAIKLFWRV